MARLVGHSKMNFHGFDSLSGLPPVSGVDADTDEFTTGDCAVPIETIRTSLTRWGVDWSKTPLHAGFFDRLDPATSPDAALVLVDCDLYESADPVPRFLRPMLQDGTIVISDDWNCLGGSDHHCEQRAVAEFLAEHPEIEAEPLFDVPPVGRAFTIRVAR